MKMKGQCTTTKSGSWRLVGRGLVFEFGAIEDEAGFTVGEESVYREVRPVGRRRLRVGEDFRYRG